MKGLGQPWFVQCSLSRPAIDSPKNRRLLNAIRPRLSEYAPIRVWMELHSREGLCWLDVSPWTATRRWLASTDGVELRTQTKPARPTSVANLPCFSSLGVSAMSPTRLHVMGPLAEPANELPCDPCLGWLLSLEWDSIALVQSWPSGWMAKSVDQGAAGPQADAVHATVAAWAGSSEQKQYQTINAESCKYKVLRTVR